MNEFITKVNEVSALLGGDAPEFVNQTIEQYSLYIAFDKLFVILIISSLLLFLLSVIILRFKMDEKKIKESQYFKVFKGLILASSILFIISIIVLIVIPLLTPYATFILNMPV